MLLYHPDKVCHILPTHVSWQNSQISWFLLWLWYSGEHSCFPSRRPRFCSWLLQANELFCLLPVTLGNLYRLSPSTIEEGFFLLIPPSNLLCSAQMKQKFKCSPFIHPKALLSQSQSELYCQSDHVTVITQRIEIAFLQTPNVQSKK